METTNIKTENKNNKLSWGAFATFAAGLIYMYLIAFGTFTDNRFGTHLVLSIDLSSAGSQEWFLWFVVAVGTLVAIAGAITFVLNYLGVIELNESQDSALKIGSTLLIGSAAFILALSSISFAAFNWQYFDSELTNGTSNQAYAWISLTIIATAIVIGLTICVLTNVFTIDRKLYLTLRNSSIALVALGWLVFNVCINSFGAMGGDANVLFENLTGFSLAYVGETLSTIPAFATAENIGDALVVASNMTPEEFYKDVLLVVKPDLPKWMVASIPFTSFWENGVSPLVKPFVPDAFYDLVVSTGGLQNLLFDGGQLLEGVSVLPNYLETFEKVGPIMGVNNSFNSLLIFLSLLGLGLFGIPIYGVLTYNNKEKTSIMFWGSIVTIISVYTLYFFLTLTPYMVNMDGYNPPTNERMATIVLLLTGNYDPSIAPGLIALPGYSGGINSAIVYFSPQYSGTVVWWISEVITFIIPAASFVGAWLTIRAISDDNNKAVEQKAIKAN